MCTPDLTRDESRAENRIRRPHLPWSLCCARALRGETPRIQYPKIRSNEVFYGGEVVAGNGVLQLDTAISSTQPLSWCDPRRNCGGSCATDESSQCRMSPHASSAAAALGGILPQGQALRHRFAEGHHPLRTLPAAG